MKRAAARAALAAFSAPQQRTRQRIEGRAVRQGRLTVRILVNYDSPMVVLHGNGNCPWPPSPPSTAILGAAGQLAQGHPFQSASGAALGAVSWDRATIHP